MFTVYGIPTVLEVVSIKLSLIKLDVPFNADCPRIAGLDQFQVLTGMVVAALKLILLPQPIERLFQLPAPDEILEIVGMGKTVTTIVYFAPRSSVTLKLTVPLAVPVRFNFWLIVAESVLLAV